MRIPMLVAALSLGVVATSLGQGGSVTVKEERAGMLAQAKIQPAVAESLALTKYPKGTVMSAQIMKRHPGGELVYAYDIQPTGTHRKRQVLVSAKDGTILKATPQGTKAPSKMP